MYSLMTTNYHKFIEINVMVRLKDETPKLHCVLLKIEIIRNYKKMLTQNNFLEFGDIGF